VTYWGEYDPGIAGTGRHFCYLSPEAASGLEHDQSADVFAVGAILFELLAGRILFLDETDYQTVEQVREAFVPPLTNLNPEVNSDLEAIVRTALAKNPKERYETVEQLGGALGAYLSRRGIVMSVSDLRSLLD
jgi:serine/threonine-protein kinase